jgi:hypothetical protein
MLIRAKPTKAVVRGLIERLPKQDNRSFANESRLMQQLLLTAASDVSVIKRR